MADIGLTSRNPPTTNPGYRAAGVSYNNQAYQPNTLDDFSRPPTYTPYSPPPSGTAGYHPQQYPLQPSTTMTYPLGPSPPPPGMYPTQDPQSATMMYAPQVGIQTTSVVVASAPSSEVEQQASCGVGEVFTCIIAFVFNPILGLIVIILTVVAATVKISDATRRRFAVATIFLMCISPIVTTAVITPVVLTRDLPKPVPGGFETRG